LYLKTGNASKEEARKTKPPQVNTCLKKLNIVAAFQLVILTNPKAKDPAFWAGSFTL
jgi:hypothetical protein